MTAAERLADELVQKWSSGYGWNNDARSAFSQAADELAAALLRASRGTEPQGWQPIETAPQGYDVLLFNGIVQINDWGDFDQHNAPKFTHWMPLPAPPGASSAAHGAAPSDEFKSIDDTLWRLGALQDEIERIKSALREAHGAAPPQEQEK